MHPIGVRLFKIIKPYSSDTLGLCADFVYPGCIQICAPSTRDLTGLAATMRSAQVRGTVLLLLPRVTPSTHLLYMYHHDSCQDQLSCL